MIKGVRMGLIGAIHSADGTELDEIMKTIIRRHGQLFPEWEVHFISLHRDAEKRKKDLEELVCFLERSEENRKSAAIGGL